MRQMISSFGFQTLNTNTEHHFEVTIPVSETMDILFSEHFALPNAENWNTNGVEKCSLPRSKWNRVAQVSRYEFNQRLKAQNLPPSAWKEGRHLLSKSFGKELVLLAWAVEDLESKEQVETAIQNWLGLAPEERWWLFTMANAVTGQAILGRGRGWRKGIAIALSDNPTQSPSMEGYRL